MSPEDRATIAEIRDRLRLADLKPGEFASHARSDIAWLLQSVEMLTLSRRPLQGLYQDADGDWCVPVPGKATA